MKSWTIVAYTYQAANMCPACIHRIFMGDDESTTEVVLDGSARYLGVNREDETSFDSGDFPKVVFADQVESNEACDACGELIID